MEVKQVPTLGWTRGDIASTIQLVSREQREAIARRVRTAMEEKGFTNARLAYKAGLSEKTVSRLINAKLEPRYDTLERIAKPLGLTEADLRGAPTAPLGLGSPESSQLDRLEAKLDEILDQLAALMIFQGVARDEQQEQKRAATTRRKRAA